MRYRDRVYGFAYRMVGNQSIAEEVTQETFLTLIRKPDQYIANKGSMLTYLCAITRNQILNHFRHSRRVVEQSYDEHNSALTNGNALNPLSSLLEHELADVVNESVGRLPLLQREVVILREFQELSYQEISEITGTKVNVVKARLHRARSTLTKHLAQYRLGAGREDHEL